MKNLFTQILNTTLLLSLLHGPAWSLTKEDVGDLETKVTKMTLQALLNEKIFPNIATPELDVSIHMSLSNDGSFLQKGFAHIEIPQTDTITHELYNNDSVNDSEIKLEIGGPRFFIIGDVELQGTKGFFGETGTFSAKVVKNPLKPDNTTIYPVVVENSQIGNVYFKIEEIAGNFSFEYKDFLCATEIHNNPICDADLIKNKSLGESLIINGVKYKITKSQSLEKIDFAVIALIQVKMGDLQGRVFKPKKVSLVGTYNLNGTYQADFKYLSEELPRD